MSHLLRLTVTATLLINFLGCITVQSDPGHSRRDESARDQGSLQDPREGQGGEKGRSSGSERNFRRFRRRFRSSPQHWKACRPTR